MAKKPASKSSRATTRSTAVAHADAGMAHLISAPVDGVLKPDGSLAYMLLRAAKTDGWMAFVAPDGSEKRVTYAELLVRANARLAGLRAAGAEAGRPALQVFKEGEDFIVTFWACVLGGIVCVPLTYPSSLKSENTALTKLYKSWEQLGRPVILGDQTLADHLPQAAVALGVTDLQVIVASSVDVPDATPAHTPGQGDDLVLIQYSSGSTGSAKGVELTHTNMLTNMEAIVMSVKPQPGETMLSWMPFSHDMGLALHLWPMGGLISQVSMPPHLFVRRPLLWLKKMHEHGSAFAGSPNFGYRLVLDELTPEILSTLDLSRMRVIFNGAEPISVPLMREFTETLAQAKLPPSAVYPVYGMAEAVVAVAFPPVGSTQIVRSVARSKLSAGGRIELIDEQDPDALLIVDEGVPVPGCELRIVDDADALLPEEVVGHVQIRGANVTRGYHQLPEVNEASRLTDGWVRTGDLGFVAKGRLSITGRAKDVVIVNGQKFFAYDIEQCAGQAAGIVPAKVVVCSWPDAELQRDRVVLFAALKKNDGERLHTARTLAGAWQAVTHTFGFTPDEVVRITSVPRTTSGKLQRYQVRQACLAGKYDENRFGMDELLNALSAPDDEVPTIQPIQPAKPVRVVDVDSLMRDLTGLWADVLKRSADAIGTDQPFLSLGGTSVKAVQLLGRVETHFATSLDHEFLLSCRTVRDMAQYLVAQFQRENLPEARNLAASLSSADAHADAHGDAGAHAQAHAPSLRDEDIAIIGMACRFPQADTPQAFWENLLHGKDNITEVPADRWDADLYFSAEGPQPGKTTSRWGGFLEGAYQFDAAFFGLTEEEARIMDPQQRLFLQATCEALEAAGHAATRPEGQRIGVFAGASHNTYMEHHQHGLDLARLRHFDSFAALDQAQREALQQEWLTRFGDGGEHPNTVVDNLLNMIAARTAHMLNLKGPALSIDTACSSSLVAVHMAAESLRRGECEMAVAGGVNLNLSPTPYLLFSRAGVLSPSGRCKVFDASADGFVPGEGVGVVLLKPLSRALSDGDQVLAVIKRSSINNDGRSLGVMAPNPDGQRVAIASAYRDADVRPDQIQYVEAHGTGTAIGDPTELRALAHVFTAHGAAPGSCVVGSVKANIGHLLAAAGVAGLIKLVQALRHKQMPPSVHVDEPNAQLAAPGMPLRLLSAPQAWDAPEQGPRRGAINSFGFGGTNCHMVIEEAPAQPVADDASGRLNRPAHVVALSARTPDALARRAAALARHLAANPDLPAVDVAHSAHTGQTHHAHRLAVVGSTLEQLASGMDEAALQAAQSTPAATPRVALMFTGQGAQYVGMARALYTTLTRFRRIVDACAQAFSPYLDVSILDSLYAEGASDAALSQTWLTQPVMFTLDYAIGRLLLDWGVKPVCLLGHSVGEYAAACLAGVMSLDDAARLIAARGRLIFEQPAGGGMMAVFDSHENLAPMLSAYEGRLWIAAHNGQHQVVSGQLEALAELAAQLQPLGKVCRPLQVSHAFHTPLLSAMLPAYEAELARTHFQPARLPLVSNLGGRWVPVGETLDAAYWRDHIPAPVCFEQSIGLALQQGVNIFVECGPDKILSNLTRNIVSGKPVHVLPSLDRKRDDWTTLLGTIATLYQQGVDVDWTAFDADFSPRRVDLPTYPFARTELRIATEVERANRVSLVGAGRAVVQHAASNSTSPLQASIAPNVPNLSNVAASMQPSARAASEEAPALPGWRNVVLEMLAELLQMRAADLDMSSNFHDLGLTSACAVEVASRLSMLTDIRLPPTLLFEYQSPVALVDFLQTLAAQPPKAAATSAHALAPSPLPATAPLASPAIQTTARDHDIAIIGIGLRVAGANNLDEFWTMLMEGRTAIREIKPDQWSQDDYFNNAEQAPSHTTYSKWGAFLERPHDFDPMFFGISPREAEVMDPQQRLFLQVAWEALQQSGYGGDFRTKEIGVFVGSEQNHYGEHFIIHQRYQALCRRFQGMPWFQAMDEAARLQLLSTLRDVLDPAELISDAVAGNGLNEIPARLSHWLDLRGPNLMVNTACSSSLVALHLACESLRSGDARLAIAGGAYLTGNDSPFVFLSRVGALSPNGVCSPFDANANGMVLGEGVSALVLKPLKDALADGDNVLAVIKGSAVNNDGHSNGITAPNPRGQAEALRKAYVNAGLSPEQVSYIECHGTGTPLGDPVELDGMTQAFRKFTDRKQFCAIGSLKSTFGHMLSGASLPSLIKVVLALRHRTIPHTVGYEKPNPHVDFASTPFHVVGGRPMSWQASGDQPLRAGVNAFGFGGTNCHVVLEEAPRQYETVADRPARPELLLLNGRTPAVLKDMAAQLLARVRREPDYQPDQVALSLNGSQRDLAHKAALVVRDRADLMAQLQHLAQGDPVAAGWMARSNPKAATPVYLVLDGVNPYGLSQIEALIADFPALQAICDECTTLHEQAMSQSHALNHQHLDDLILTFAVQYGLGRLLMSAEVKPVALLAEGTGVLVAACLLGMLTLKQGIDMLGRLALGRHDGLDQVLHTPGQGSAPWHCPLLIADAVLQGSDDDAVVRLGGYLQQPRHLGAGDLRLSGKGEHAVVHLGGSPQMRQQLGQGEGLRWVGLGESGSPSERVLSLFAALHLHGVRFNSRPLVRPGARRVMLPTYPFENKAYHFKPVALPSFDADAKQAADQLIASAARGEARLALTLTDGGPPTTAAAPAAPPAASPALLAPARLMSWHGSSLSEADRRAQADALAGELGPLPR
jgi:acyl transferase domain-containing protein/acyl-CoA synthetase (AMP-forming)/AMP-acid ligase II